MGRKKYIIFIVIAIVFIALFFRYSGRAPKRQYGDFRVYYSTAKRFIGRENIYDRPDMSIGPYKYSPIFAMLVSPLSFFSKKAASLLFFTVNFILVIAIFVLSNRLIMQKTMSSRQNVLLYTLTVICSFRFILHVLDSGQVSVIMLALVVAGLHFLNKNKNALGASFMGLSIMVKYMPAIFLPYFLFRKKIKLVVFVLIFIMLYCLIPASHVGMHKEVNYLKVWFPSITETSLDRNSWYDNKNQSLYSLSLRYLTKDSPYRVSIARFSFNQVIAITGFLGMVIYLFIVLPRGSSGFNRSLEYSLLFIFTALFNPNAWMHNFVVFVFVYMTLFCYLIKINFKDRITVALVILSFALMTLTSELFVGDSLETIFEELSFLTIGGLILAFSLFRLKFKRGEK